MAAVAQITLTGADGLIELLRTLPEKQLLPAVNKGMRAVGSKTTRDARKDLYKGHGVRTGATKKSLGVRKIKTYKREGRVVMYIGTRRGFRLTLPSGKAHDPFYIAHFVEERYEMLKRAVDANKGEFDKQMVAKILAVLEKAKARGK
jgi:hypothetical protein